VVESFHLVRLSYEMCPSKSIKQPIDAGPSIAKKPIPVLEQAFQEMLI